MILFLTSRKGFDDPKHLINQKHWPVWLSKGMLSKDEIEKLKTEDIEITEFSYEIDDRDKNKIEEARYTIQEHHPDEQIFVERRIAL